MIFQLPFPIDRQKNTLLREAHLKSVFCRILLYPFYLEYTMNLITCNLLGIYHESNHVQFTWNIR